MFPAGLLNDRSARQSGSAAKLESLSSAASEARGERCFHCTEAVDPRDAGRWTVRFEGVERDLCCAGCQAVAGTILAAGLEDYYRFRTEPAAFGLVPADLAGQLDPLGGVTPPGGAPADEAGERWAVYDAPEVFERYTTERDDGSREVVLAVEGMRCGACVWLLERSLQSLPGVAEASVNYASERARVRIDPARTGLADLFRGVARVGYRATPFDVDARDAAERRASRLLLQRLFVAGLGAMQVMMYALPGYLDGDIEPRFVELLRWASLVLTTPVMLFAAQPFFAGAWRDLKARSPGMDVPVAIGLAVAFGASVVSTLGGGGEVWFDSVSMFVFLLLGARWLERAARQRARRALDKVLGAVPDTARRRVGDTENKGGDNDRGRTAAADAADDVAYERVPAQRLVVGDRVRVDSGERVPADATVCTGSGAVDLSLLTGESEPVPVQVGDAVPGGALVSGSPLQLEVRRRVADSTLSMIGELVDRGAAERPAIARLADRIARLFVTALLVVVAVVFAVWWRIDPARAPEIAIAVLIVSCPCALSLATPAALAAATGRLLGAGVLVTRGHALEAMATVDDVVFDKTGTLTLGTPRVVAVTRAGADRVAGEPALNEHEILSLAARLDAGAAHPYAAALRAAAARARAAAGEGEGEIDASARDGGRVGGQGGGQGGGEGGGEGGGQGGVAVRFAAPVHEAGFGVRATDLEDATRSWRLGSARHCGLDEVTVADWRARGGAGLADRSDVFLVRCGPADAVEVLARIAFEDPLRPGAAELVDELQRHGRRVHLLSGDRAAVVRRVAEACGIEHVVGDASPADKQTMVAALQRRGSGVMMVGDGINDAPVMAIAEVSLAVGRASDLARGAADAVALGDGIDAIGDTLALARHTRSVIRQNLGWALGYNALAIPFTAAGLVPAWAAAIGMASSSLLVSANALRLLRSDPVRPPGRDEVRSRESTWTR